MSKNNSPTISNRYIVDDILGSGGMGIVYQASDRLSGDQVALKQVTVPPQQLLFNSRTGSDHLNIELAQEFKTLASLRHPNIVAVRDFGFDSQRLPFFTMDLLKDAKTIVEAGQGQPTAIKVSLLVQLLQALAYLHRRGVLHRDLKPANVLVVNGQVKILDFGLSMITERSVADITQSTTGTFAYMAPELFQGEPPSRRSDLYAVGMVAYEMFSGHYPYNLDNLAVLITQIISTPIDLGVMGENQDLNAVIGKLLNREEKERYRNAGETIQALCMAIGMDPPLETTEIRESYLQAAKFIGREEELQVLSAELQSAIGGKGGITLIGGESGIGKTRLSEEVRILAMVAGMLVLSGQAIQQGGNSYQLWREVLRPMVLHIKLTDKQAAILNPMVQDIGEIMGREIQPAPDLNDPQQNQVRLFKTIESCIASLKQPTLIILEDLQWAGSESLALLERIGNISHELPVLFIGNYRDDEMNDLPQQVGNPRVLGLQRFSDESIEELSAAMLGKVGHQREIIDFLNNETEGNVFFLVEVVRALAEEAGEIGWIDSKNLPDYVTAGGIQAVIDRRLNRVPAGARPLLRQAAVIGRRLDLEVLERLDTEINISDWLISCSNAAVLEVKDDHWRFSHDKLRESLLAEIGKEEHQSLSKKAAEAIESIHPEDPAWVKTLAYLWEAAAYPENELHYSALAGFQAYQNLANIEAIKYLKRAIFLLEHQPENPESIPQEINLQLTLGFSLMRTYGYGYEQCADAFDRARILCESIGNPPELAIALWGMAHFYYLRGDYDLAAEMGEAINDLAPQTEIPVVYQIGANFMLSACRMIVGDFEGCLGYRDIMEHYYQLADDDQLSRALGYNPASFIQHWFAFSLHAMGYQDQAMKDFDRLVEMSEESDHVFNLSQNLSVGSLTLRSMGEVKKLKAVTDRAIEVATKHEFLTSQGQITGGWAKVQTGQVDEGINQIKEGVDFWTQTGALTVVAEYYFILADAYRENGMYREGIELLDKAIELVENHNMRYIEVDIHRLRGDLMLLLGADLAEAEQHYQKAVEVAIRQKAKLFELRAVVSLARLWQSQGRGVDARERLAEIFEWFTEGFETRDLIEAKELLEELG